MFALNKYARAGVFELRVVQAFRPAVGRDRTTYAGADLKVRTTYAGRTCRPALRTNENALAAIRKPPAYRSAGADARHM